MEFVEEWQAVVGYQGAYEVSSAGRVRSLPRRVISGRMGQTRRVSGRTLAIYRGDRYSKVRLKLSDGGKTWNVHQLVALAFLGAAPDGMEVCHNNGNHHDNRVSNLRYDTHSNNQRDTVRLGGNINANKTHCKNDHEFTPQNTRRRADGNRACRACERAWKQVA